MFGLFNQLNQAPGSTDEKNNTENTVSVFPQTVIHLSSN